MGFNCVFCPISAFLLCRLDIEVNLDQIVESFAKDYYARNILQYLWWEIQNKTNSSLIVPLAMLSGNVVTQYGYATYHFVSSNATNLWYNRKS